MIGIGIDTGGTYTDAVVYDMNERRVLCSGKTLTTRHNLEVCVAAVLDRMDQELVKKAELLALSTTLATNACLEDKGSRAKCLMIGMQPQHMANLEQVYAGYGLRDLNQLVFIDGKPENLFANPEEPDWDALMEQAEEWFHDCAAIGVTQIYPRADGGRLERRAKEILRDKMNVPVTTAYDLFDEVDVLKRGAGTLLNARLVPLIDEFLQAVRAALKERGLDIPLAIVRSDGSLMSELMTRDVPVETLLSGPAASAIGGSVLTREDNAVIVDMGGTTTDVALIRDGHPLTASQGIAIGPWRTTVRGLYVDTFLLGGDSEICFSEGEMVLEGRRVIPISLLASRWPSVGKKLNALAYEGRHHTRMISEFFVLQREIREDEEFAENEKRICEALKDGPLPVLELAEEVGASIYTLRTERLEEEGVLMKSGLTPTDIMAVKGDFPIYDPQAALDTIRFLAENVSESPEEIPDAVYKLVEKKMYCNLVRILMEVKYPRGLRMIREDGVQKLVEHAFEEAYEGRRPEWLEIPFMTDLPLIGVGAPIHIFLPKVAALLGTRAVICEESPVANALGAIASQIVTRVELRVKAEYEGAALTGYSVYRGEERIMFDKYGEACEFAEDLARRLVLEKAKKQGSSSNPEIKISRREIKSSPGKTGLLFEGIVEAVATDTFQL